MIVANVEPVGKMTKVNQRLYCVPCVFAALIAATSVRAEEAGDATETASAFTIDAALAVVSDYRFRGISLADKEPAVQPDLTIGHKSGLYLNLWGSNIAGDGGDDIEVDVTLGFAGSVGKVDYDLSAALYSYPGASQFNYLEMRGSLKTGVGPATLGAQVAYAPRQDHIGGVDNLYVAANGELPIARTPLKLIGTIGLEDGAFGDRKIDWTLGVNADVAGFTLSASYVDTARSFGNPLANATVVVSLSRSF